MDKSCIDPSLSVEGKAKCRKNIVSIIFDVLEKGERDYSGYDKLSVTVSHRNEGLIRVVQSERGYRIVQFEDGYPSEFQNFGKNDGRFLVILKRTISKIPKLKDTTQPLLFKLEANSGVTLNVDGVKTKTKTPQQTQQTSIIHNLVNWISNGGRAPKLPEREPDTTDIFGDSVDDWLETRVQNLRA